MRLPAELAEGVNDRRLHGGVVDGPALPRLEDDVDVVSGPGAEAALEEVLRLLGVRAGRAEREVVVATEGARREDRGDEERDPQHQHPSPAAVRPVGETHEQCRAGRGGARTGRRRLGTHRIGSSGSISTALERPTARRRRTHRCVGDRREGSRCRERA